MGGAEPDPGEPAVPGGPPHARLDRAALPAGRGPEPVDPSGPARPDGASEPTREGRPPGEARCGMARPPSRASREGILARGTGVTSRIDWPPPSFHP